MRILCCGDRKWTNKELIRTTILEYYLLSDDVIIIHGCATGADTLSGQIGEEYGLHVIPFPADWDKYVHHKGSPAGPIRNQKMLTEGLPQLVLAFHNDIQNSVGTKDMVKRAEKDGIKVVIISEDKPKKLPLVT